MPFDAHQNRSAQRALMAQLSGWSMGMAFALSSLTVAAAPCSAGLSQDDVLHLTRSGHIKAFPAILEKARHHHSGKLLEAELECDAKGRYVYEIELLDQDGMVWELKFNAVTGDYITANEEE
ncbi:MULTISPECIES: PepSY domain-containing protein [Larsenimonas]|uniref:PepSY domain-containing protein n=1 Tax=Larsenimonas suaedae TaxID=1851019 RepID=A0ABU1GXM2_9GAMM|nr:MULTISPECIES: PepSY domain-containing protein [Larsenimonas]MCM2973153.1 PepSY domain-containing protein [Larsenimonas suaedae]MCM5705572.1 PepSY domain-containing protein [Larsenimonas salina]MDR5896590.1 PepSY domain-containing protein [Larsenimonas suaedae]